MCSTDATENSFFRRIFVLVANYIAVKTYAGVTAGSVRWRTDRACRWLCLGNLDIRDSIGSCAMRVGISNCLVHDVANDALLPKA
jgi:hypothetical protein